MIINIEKKINLEYEFLDQNIETHLFNKIKKTFEGECIKEHGYILSVLRLIEIKDNIIYIICAFLNIIINTRDYTLNLHT